MRGSWAIRSLKVPGWGRCRRPPASSAIGERATLEPDVDLHGWWIDGDELVVDELQIGPDARVGTRAVLMPGAAIDAGAEVEAGAVISGRGAGRTAVGWLAGQADRRRRRWLARRRRAGKAHAPAPEGHLRARPGGCRASLPLLASLPGIALLTALFPAPLHRRLGGRDDRHARAAPGAELRARVCRPDRARGSRRLAAGEGRMASRRRDRWLGAVVQRVAHEPGPRRPVPALLEPLHAAVAATRRYPDRQAHRDLHRGRSQPSHSLRGGQLRHRRRRPRRARRRAAAGCTSRRSKSGTAASSGMARSSRPPHGSATTASWACSPRLPRRAPTERPGSVHRRSSCPGSPTSPTPLAPRTQSRRLIAAQGRDGAGPDPAARHGLHDARGVGVPRPERNRHRRRTLADGDGRSLHAGRRGRDRDA